MESYPRGLLQSTKFMCIYFCPRQPPLKPPAQPPPPPPTPPHPQPPPPPGTPNQHSLFLFIIAAIGAVGFGIAYAFILKYYFKRMAEIRRRRRRNLNPPILFRTQDEEDFQDEEHGPIDHPIWYINTIGLQQSVIDSIAVFKYKRDEGLTEGTECSVCLGEFCEDESLRLLPKCSHAFHLPCIDTWLRSHKNCPLCRAPVLKRSRSHDGRVVEENNVNVSVSQQNISEEVVREGSDTSSNPVDTQVNSRGIMENLEKDLHDQNSASCELVGNELLDKRVAMEEEMQVQPVRRSVSMNALPGRIMDNIVQMKNYPKASSGNDNRNGESSSAHRSIRSYTFGLSLPKGPVSMKRSSSSGKIWSSRQWRRHNLPISM